jgi:hypothetical protein
LFVAMFSFPRTVLSLKQSTEPTQVHLLVDHSELLHELTQPVMTCYFDSRQREV